MNFIENITLQTERQKNIGPTPIKEEGIILAKKEIEEIMKQAKFPTDYIDYSFQFDDGNHPGGDTEQDVIISSDYLHKKLSGSLIYLNAFKIRLLSIQENNQSGLIDFSKEEEIATEIHREASKICKILNTGQNPMIKNMAHNIKNMLNGIMGFLNLLNQEENPKEKSIMIRTLLNNIERMELFCKSSIEHIQRGSRLIPIYLDKYWGGVKKSYEEECKKNNISFFADFPINFITDDFTLRSVIEDLFSNALKYTPRGGTIALSAEIIEINNNKTAEIHFFNSGSSISEGKDPFNVEQSTLGERNGMGTGIGLRGVKQLLENTEERISYKNTIRDFPNHPGCKGVEFIFTLPFSSLQKREQNK